MKNKTLHLIYISVIILLSVWLYSLITEPQTKSIDITDYSKKIDSLESLISRKNIIFKSKIDTLNSIIYKLTVDKKTIIANYETKYKSFTDVRIVSDDSITKYISNKIHNR